VSDIERDELEALVETEHEAQHEQLDAVAEEAEEKADAAIDFSSEEEAMHIVSDEVVAAQQPDASEDDDDVYSMFKAEFRALPGKWYVVHSYAGYEKRVKQNIENRASVLAGGDLVFEVVVPIEETIEVKGGERKLVKKVMIPGYVWVRMDLPRSPDSCSYRLRRQRAEPNSIAPNRGVGDAEEGSLRRPHS
jgi:transcriptional antiterminator NusG